MVARNNLKKTKLSNYNIVYLFICNNDKVSVRKKQLL